VAHASSVLRPITQSDVVSKALIAGTSQQPKQRSPFVCSGSTEKVVPVASQQQATTVVGKLEDGFVGGIAAKDLRKSVTS
jgi:outer membrane lipoprotein SlyB